MIEQRHLSPQQSNLRVLRSADEKSVTISGYAAVFYRPDNPGTEFPIFEDLVERVMPGAFDSAIAQDDVRGLVNHDASQLVGRTKAGTLKLSVDDIGLLYQITVPDTQAGRDVVTSIERADLDGSSFGFNVWGKRGRVTYTREIRDGKTIDVRELRDLELLDVGPVTFPAYTATTATRSKESQTIREDIRQRRLIEEAQLAVVEVCTRAAILLN